jgi:hypothetical protein
MTIKSIFKTLHTELTKPGAPFPVHTGDIDVIKDYGLCYYLTPRKHNHVPAPWFKRTLHVQRLLFDAQRFNQQVPDFHPQRVMLLVHWPYFLWQARSNSKSHLKVLAQDLIRELTPLIVQYDTVMAHYVTKGLDYSTHLHLLLENSSFKQHLTRTMDKSLSVLLAKSERNTLIKCPSGTKHKKGQYCDSCTNTKWVRRNTSLLYVDRLEHIVQTKLVIVSPEFYLPTHNQLSNELRFWFDCATPEEGVYRVDNTNLLVNHKLLLERAEKEDRDSLLRKYLTPGDHNTWQAAVAARRDIVDKLGISILGRRSKSLDELVSEAGWENNYDSLSTPFEVYSIPQLVSRLDRTQRSIQHLRNVNPAKRKEGLGNSKPKLKIASLVYTDENGVAHGISCVRRHIKTIYNKTTNFYSIPYEPPVSLIGAKQRVGLGISVDGKLYWNLHGVNKHATLFLENPLVQHFAQWLAPIDAKMNQAYFKNLLYADARPIRVAKLQRGEVDNIGRFVEWEDNAIREFMLQRQSHTTLAPVDWLRLMELLPGRTRRGISARIEHLGYQYYKEHGWVAYINSGLCQRVTTIRRRKWEKMKRSRLVRN